MSVTKKGMEQEVVDGGKQLRVGGSETKGERFKGEKREEAWGRPKLPRARAGHWRVT